MAREGKARNFGRFVAWLAQAMLFLPLGLAGCGQSRDVVPLADAEKSLMYVALAYSECYSKLGHGPKDADEIKPFLKEFGDPDQLLVSPNDGKPFVVIWGENPSGGPTPYKQMFPILAYEHTGVGGMRVITDVRGMPMTIPAEDFSQLTFVGRHQPSAE